MGKRRICYVVHWSDTAGGPESRIYPNLGPSLVQFIADLGKQYVLSDGPVVERIVLSDLTKEEKRKLKEIQDGK